MAAACGCAKQEERGESGLGPIFCDGQSDQSSDQVNAVSEKDRD